MQYGTTGMAIKVIWKRINQIVFFQTNEKERTEEDERRIATFCLSTVSIRVMVQGLYYDL